MVIQSLGNIDMKKLYNYCMPQKFWQIVIVNGESVGHLKDKYTSNGPLNITTVQLIREAFPAAGRKVGKEVGQGLFIVDLEGFGYALPRSLSF